MNRSKSLSPSQSAIQKTVACVVVLLTGACASTESTRVDSGSAPQGGTLVAADGGDAANAESAEPIGEVSPADVTKAIEQALAEGWQDLHILTECQLDSSWHSVEIFGNGVGIWGKEAQFTLTRDQQRQLLEALQEADFGNLAALYGGPRGRDAEVPQGSPAAIPPPTPGTEVGAGIHVRCRVILRLDGVVKKVAQRRAGEQSPVLRGLAERILAICREPARSGLGAADLNDGLSKVVAGELAPETVEIRWHRKPRSGTNAEGWLLRLKGLEASTRRFQPGQGYGEIYLFELPRDDFQELLGRLASQNPGRLPINLFAEHYSDVEIRVLDQRQGILAQRFAGMTAGSHGEKQERFDQILEELSELHRQILAQGRPRGS